MRAVLGGAVLGGAAAEGLPRTGVLLAVGAGVVVLAVSLANRRGVRVDRLPSVPKDAVLGAWWQATARAALPSTVGLAVLGGIALGFSRGLAGLCGGLLAGLAILGLAFGVLLRSEERREGFRLYVDWGILQPRRFVGPPTPVSDTGPNAG